jgi:two-component system phosphate regulon sensor histidine kinase PhoR
MVDEDGKPAKKFASDLAMMLADARKTLRLVVLNCCESARINVGERFGNPAMGLMMGGSLPAVVAMQFPISDDAAIRMSEGFYKALANNVPVDDAVKMARRFIRDKSRIEFGIPVLYMRSADGKIFEVDNPVVTPPEADTFRSATKEELQQRRDGMLREHEEELTRVRTGGVGRPSSMHLVLDELRRRALENHAGQLRVGRVVARTLQVQAVGFSTGAGARAGTVAVFHDISELARLEEVRRDFVANASHELRTPLAAIRGFAETLLDGGALVEAERRSYLEIIDRHAQRLTHIVHDLLELSTIERGRIRLEPVELDVGELVTSWIRDSGPRLRERRLEIVHEAAGRVMAWADPHALEQILGNLLDNAVKYTEPGGRIEIRVENGDPKVRVRVKDTGIGIPEEDLARIFERFYRVDKARSRELGGTGLGLAIVKHLVQSLGGEISVQSRLGEGSTFTFTLPRRGPAA